MAEGGSECSVAGASLLQWHSLGAWHTTCAASHSCALHTRDDIMLGQPGFWCSARYLQLPFQLPCSTGVHHLLLALVIPWTPILWWGATAAFAPWRVLLIAIVFGCHRPSSGLEHLSRLRSMPVCSANVATCNKCRTMGAIHVKAS